MTAADASPSPGVGALFDRVARTYDEVGVPWFGPIAQGLVDALAVQPGEDVVDLGCGKGAALLPLAEHAGPRARVVGVDISAGMAALARVAAAGRGLDQVEVVVGDAAEPPLPPASVDVVASSLVVFFLPDPQGALTRWATLLRPGGRLGISTFGPRDPAWVELDGVFAPYLPPELMDARTSGARGPFSSDAGVEGLLHAAGLVDVRTVTARVTAVCRDADHWYAFSTSHGQRAMWESVPAAQQAAVKEQAYAVLARTARPDGSIHLDQQVRYTLGAAPRP